MTEQNPTPPDDRELEDFLAGRGPLSRAQREGTQEPAPPELDAKVLAAAREDLRRARPARRLLRWDSPLALAASMLLVVSLGWLMQRQVPRPGPGEAVPESMVTPAAAPAPAPQQASPASREEQSSALARKAVEPSARPAASAKAKSAPLADRVEPADTPAPPPPPAPVAADAVTAQPPAAFSEPTRDRQVQREKAPSPDAAPATAAEAFAPAPAPVAPQAKAGSGFANSAAMAARAQADPCASPRRQPAQLQARPEQNLDAPAWLDRIRTLRDADPAAARAELACLVARKPQVEVPDDLRPLLQTGAP